MKYYTYAAKFLVIVLAIFIIFVCSLYKYKTGPVSNNTDNISFKVVEVDTYYSLANKLYEAKLIRSGSWFKLYVKLFNPTTLIKGTYNLNQSMGIAKIIDVLTNSVSVVSNITFREGLNMREIASVIEKNTEISKQDVYDLLNDKTYMQELIEKYWFLENDVLNDKIYYPLEGYLFPDTYTFSLNDVTVKQIFETMLDNTSKKLESLKENLNSGSYSIHEIITMASIVEKEAGNANDMTKVAAVFYNRMNTPGETLGSDVTAYYGAKMDDWTSGLGSAEKACNGYNTRLYSTCPISGLPVGPVSNPGIDAIKAALNPDSTKAMFFVADCKGNVYLSNTYAEHSKVVANLKKENNWCDN